MEEGPRVRWFRFGAHDDPEDGYVLSVDNRGHFAEWYCQKGMCRNEHGEQIVPSPIYWAEIVGADMDSDVEPPFEIEWVKTAARDPAPPGAVVGAYREKPTLRLVVHTPDGWFWRSENVAAPDWWGVKTGNR